MATPHLNLTPAPAAPRHPPPKTSFKHSYTPSSIDSNLLILFHGLGDTHAPFTTLGRSLSLPQTAVLSLQAPTQVPLLEEPAFQWWHSFDELGELVPNPNPSTTLKLLLALLEHLTTPAPGPGWNPADIHLFGFAQGGICAGELALAWARTKKEPLGSVVAISAPLLSHPTVGEKVGTKALVAVRKGEERSVGVASWRKGFGNVQELSLPKGGGMLRGREEWEEVMRCVFRAFRGGRGADSGTQVLGSEFGTEVSDGVWRGRVRGQRRSRSGAECWCKKWSMRLLRRT